MEYTKFVATAVLQNAQTSGNGAEVDLGGETREVTAYIEFSAGVTAGAVQIETAHAAGYTGTWAPLGAAVGFTASSVKVAQAAGVFRAIRARISTAVTGGTVTVRIVAN